MPKTPKHYGLETEQLCPENGCWGFLVRIPRDELACPECGLTMAAEPDPWFKRILDALFD